MTREEALKTWLPVIKMGVESMPECSEALDMAIEALEQEPCTNAISREDALMALTGEWKESRDEILSLAIRRIRVLPLVKPAEKMGHWIFVHPLQEDDGGGYMCSICNVGDWNLNGKENYCPNCGAKMQERKK